jgi:TolB-like protein/Tfp pilus assembly protein PilF
MSNPDFWFRIRGARLLRVLIVYAGASWAVIEATEFFVSQFAMPDWFVPAALLLLLIGLVVVISTALVQAGPAPDPIRSRPGLATPAEEGARRLFTWRNAIMGGVFAFAIWGIAAAGWLLTGGQRGTDSSADSGRPDSAVKKLVVLPFENLSGEQDEYFAAGITDAITARLAVLSGVGVISRQSAVQYGQSEKTAQQIGSELNVDYILEGTVQRERPNDPTSRVRVIPQLIRITDDTHVWAATYDEDMAEVFRVQSEIAERVAQALDVTLLEPERRTLEARPSENLEAYDYYLRGNEYFNRGELGYLERAPLTAVEMYERALELDPSFALAWAALARAHMRVYQNGFDPEAGRVEQARDAAERALELEPDLPKAHLALGEYYVEGRNLERATEEFERARRANPNDSELLMSYADVLARRNENERSLAILEKAAELDPRSVTMATVYGSALGQAGRHAEAESFFDRAIELAPTNGHSRFRRQPHVVELHLLQSPAGRVGGVVGSAVHRVVRARYRISLLLLPRQWLALRRRRQAGNLSCLLRFRSGHLGGLAGAVARLYLLDALAGVDLCRLGSVLGVGRDGPARAGPYSSIQGCCARRRERSHACPGALAIGAVG